jgi:hypothetical protein
MNINIPPSSGTLQVPADQQVTLTPRSVAAPSNPTHQAIVNYIQVGLIIVTLVLSVVFKDVNSGTVTPSDFTNLVNNITSLLQAHNITLP